MFEPRRIAVCLLLLGLGGLLPGLTEARAAPVEAQEPAPTPDALPPPPLVPAEPAPTPDGDDASAEAPGPAVAPEPAGEPWTPRRRPVGMPVRGMLEVLGAGLTGTAGAFVGGFAGATLPDCDGEGCFVTALFGGLVGAAAGLPLGVYGAGRLAGRRGSLGGSYLGMLVGGGAALLGAIAIGGGEDGSAFFTVPVSALIGAIVGFEITADPDSAPYRSESRRPSSPTLLVPTAGTTPHGGFVGGLSGRF